MHRKFVYQESQPSQKNEVVELPIYSQHDLDSAIVYHKLFARTEHGYTLQTVQIDDGGEISFKEMSFMGNDLGQNGNYYLGKGEFSSSKEKYEAALTEAKHTLSFYEP